MPHDLAVAQVYEQANLVPFAADAHVGEVAHDVGMGRAAVELAVEDVGRLRLARLGGTGFAFLANRTGQTIGPIPNAFRDGSDVFR